MNSVVLCAILGYHNNLISDLVTMNIWDLFIQVHWGSWGKSPCYRAQPPSIATLPSCHVCTTGATEWLMTELVVALKTSGDSKQKPSPLSLAPSLGTFGRMLLACIAGQYAADRWMYTEYVCHKLNTVILESSSSLFQYCSCFPAKHKASRWPLCHIWYSIPL